MTTTPTPPDDVKPIRDALADYSFWAGCPTVLENALAHIDAQAVRLEAAERDAERYQLLRRGQHWSVIDCIGDPLRAEVLDAAIDRKRAAIASEAKT